MIQPKTKKAALVEPEKEAEQHKDESPRSVEEVIRPGRGRAIRGRRGGL